MTMVPHTVGPIHFVGIGGIGMSGIAEILSNLGYRVQGSDIGDSANVQRLRRQGIEVAIGHATKNLGKARVVVVSTAAALLLGWWVARSRSAARTARRRPRR